ncbi:MAG: hypothetical protein JNM76_14675 [Betaproteobacteria bacterium]|nr:hypothetical protein [Betaproteobacteria bacterium]
MSRILPSRFYHRDPAELADELMSARESAAAAEARRLMERLAEASAPPPRMPRRFLTWQQKRDRIEASVRANRGNLGERKP